MTAETVMITGHGGDEIEAYVARPNEDGAHGGVVVIHHMPGYDRATKAPDAAPDDAAATARAQGGVPDERLVGDVGGGAEYLRGLPSSNGKVGVIGYCSGGRQSVLAACNLELDAAVDCYGAFVVGDPPEGFPLKVTSLVDQLPNLSAPLLGLFGNEDSHPSPEQVNELDEILTSQGKPHEFHRYDDAGHAFFSVDRPAYRVAAANDGWEQITEFYKTNLGG